MGEGRGHIGFEGKFQSNVSKLNWRRSKYKLRTLSFVVFFSEDSDSLWALISTCFRWP